MATNDTPRALVVSRCKTNTFDGYRLDVSDADGPYALVGREQDARLFAAAPDLYAVAVEAENWFDNHGDEDDPGAMRLLRMFRAAIAKADGKAGA